MYSRYWIEGFFYLNVCLCNWISDVGLIIFLFINKIFLYIRILVLCMLIRYELEKFNYDWIYCFLSF